MKNRAPLSICTALAAIMSCVANPCFAQPLEGAPASSGLKYSTPMPPGVAIPDKVETRFGTLHFFGGFPDQASVDKLYDNLDFQHAVQAYLLALPVVNQVGNRNGIRAMGPANTTVPIWEQMVDSRTVPPTTTRPTLGSGSISTKDRWLLKCRQRCWGWLMICGINLGITGADKGRGGRYLLLPPGYTGKVPNGYFVCGLRPTAYGRSGAAFWSMATQSPASMP